MTTVAIIGGGNVGGALARTFARAGMTVRLGVRSIEKAAPADGVTLTAPPDAVRGADLIFLCVPSAVAVDVARALDNLDGRVIVDCTNPVAWDGGAPALKPPPEGSVTEALQRAIPGARVVKAFNHFGAEVHAAPGLPGAPTPAFLAGDDAHAKRAVADVAQRAGFDPVDAGSLRNARLLEALAVLWIHLATKGGRGRRWAFTLGG